MTHEELERENVDINIKNFAEANIGKYYAPIKTAALIFISTQVRSACVSTQCERVALR